MRRHPADPAAAPHRPRAGRSAASGGGKLVIGAFEDGALTPFKETILPMFEQATGIKVQFLTEPYDSFFAKAFQDGQSKAGQYDIYIMDDPWIPQYAAAGILEDLGAHGITADSDYAPRSRNSATGRRSRARASRASRTTSPS